MTVLLSACDSEYGDFEKTGITHWMPLPDPPEKEA